MNANPLKQIIAKQKAGEAVGIYSACSANSYVIEAAIECAKRDNSCVLIEATANQVDQNGGYTGMKPADFRDFVFGIAKKVGFTTDRIFLGGDHLGPLTFASKPEAEAILARVCEDTYQELLKSDPDAVRPVYIVGSEVPIPGGAQDPNAGMQVTRVEDFKATVAAFEKAFKEAGLEETWKDVIACVVQPGVEEKDAGCTEYDRAKAAELMASIKEFPNLVFEGHSTDYQTKYKLKELVEDGVGILKVGPGLTYAMREALFALAYMEEMIMHGKEDEQSHFIDVLEKAMLAEPKNWQKHYHGDENELWFKRKFSFSDRSRYYMPVPEVNAAKEKMIANLRKYGVSLAVLSQFMPIQYTKVREGVLENDPEVLIKDRIKNTIDEYLFASHQEKLF